MDKKWVDMSSRERDALVAEKVMGFKVFEGQWAVGPHYNDGISYETEVPYYTTDIKATWDVVGKFTSVQLCKYSTRGWTCCLYDGWILLASEIKGPTAPEAICLAALIAVEEKKNLREFLDHKGLGGLNDLY